MLNIRRAYIAATLFAIIIGLSFLFVKVALQYASPLDALAHRFTIAFLAIVVVLSFKKKSMKLSSKDVSSISLLATFYPVLFFGFQVFGLVYTSSSGAGIIQATVPIFTLVLSSAILKEKSSAIQKVAISVSVIGVIYMMSMNGIDGNGMMFIGLLFILLSTISQSFYQVVARSKTKDYSLITIIYILTFIGFLIFNGLSLTSHIINGSIREYLAPFGELTYVLAIIYLGILSTLVTSYLSTYSLSILPAFQISVFGNLTTVITILAGVIILDEPFYYFHVIGTVLIIIGVVGVNYFGEKVGKREMQLETTQLLDVKSNSQQ